MDAGGREVVVGSIVEVLVARKALVRDITYADQGEPIATLQWQDNPHDTARVLWNHQRARLLYQSGKDSGCGQRSR